MIRDQANRAMDVYLQKIRKAAASMPDTVLPPPQASDTPVPRMGTPQSTENAGWTGWAISSFTNKLSTAAGEMQTNGSSPGVAAGDTKRPVTASASSLHRQAMKSPTPEPSRTTSPNPTNVANAFLQPSTNEDDDDVGDSWGDMGDMDEDGIPDNSKPSTTKKNIETPAPFVDDGEPDFEGWLAAQAQKKSGSSKQLPKGLGKSTAAKKPMAKPASKPVVAKKLDLKPKETADDDNWGDGW
jgi:SCY1-like protein 1